MATLVFLSRMRTSMLRHGSTALAIVLLSSLVTLLVPHVFGSWVEKLASVASELPPALRHAAAAVRPIATADTVYFLDVLLVSILFFSAYGVIVVVRRLQDTVRILKVSRRRLAHSLTQ